MIDPVKSKQEQLAQSSGQIIKPVHVTFSGVDADTPTSELMAISRDYPVEWGVCLHPESQGKGRYPLVTKLTQILSTDLNLAAHLSGSYANDVTRRKSTDAILESILHRFRRIQINANDRPIDPVQIATFAAKFNSRGIMQCRGLKRFPNDPTVDWLFDRSRGTGRLPSRWPIPCQTNSIVGYSGGLGPQTIQMALSDIGRNHPIKMPFWLDMESRIRTRDRFDLRKCQLVCALVFGS